MKKKAIKEGYYKVTEANIWMFMGLMHVYEV